MPWLNSKYDVVMQMAALRRTSYAQISQQHHFNTVVSFRDILKQSYSAVGLKQHNSVGSTWIPDSDPMIIWDRGSICLMSILSSQFFASTRSKLKM